MQSLVYCNCTIKHTNPLDSYMSILHTLSLIVSVRCITIEVWEWISHTVDPWTLVAYGIMLITLQRLITLKHDRLSVYIFSQIDRHDITIMDIFVKCYNSAIEATLTKRLYSEIDFKKGYWLYIRNCVLYLLLSLIYKTIEHTHLAVRMVRVKMKKKIGGCTNG